MFKNLFHPDSGLYSFLNQMTDVLLISLMWIVLCIPLVTIGPATAAMYDTTVRVLRRREKGTCRLFWEAFRSNLKKGIVLTFLWGAVMIAVGYGLIQLWNGTVAGAISWPMFSGVCFAVYFLLGIQGMLFPVLSRFENSVGKTVVNTLVLGLANLPRMALLALPIAIGVAVCIFLGWAVALVPGIVALVSTWIIEPIFAPYMPDEDE